MISSQVLPAAGLDCDDFAVGTTYCTSSREETITVAHRPGDLSSSTIFTIPASAGRNGDADNWCTQIWIARYDLRVFLRYKDGPYGWGNWKELAAAVPPTRYNIPWAVGPYAYGDSYYSKDQFGIVHLVLDIISGSEIKSGQTIATLPVGFRPQKNFEIPAVVDADRTICIVIQNDGKIRPWTGAVNTIAPNTKVISGSTSFLAAP